MLPDFNDNSMLILIPILLLFLLAIAILLLGKYKLSVGSTWLVTAGSVLFVWMLLIVFRVALPGGVLISNWSPLGVGADLLVFKLTDTTWIFAFLLVSLLVGVIFSDTIRLEQGNHLTTWTGSMVLTAVGLLSIFSQTLLAVIITWTIIDFVEVGILIRVLNHPKVHFAGIIEFATRIIGTILVVSALVISNFHTEITGIAHYSQAVYILFILGSILRLGILPLHVPLTANLPIRRSLGTILRFVAPISVLSFLVQVQPQLQYSAINRIILPFALITAFFGSIKWALAKNELSGRPYWMLAFSGLVIVCALRGQADGIIALSVILVICGGFIFLNSYSTKLLKTISVIGMVGMIGFPFTPTALIWTSLMNSAHPLANILFIIIICLLIFGFLKHLFRPKNLNSPKELWMKLSYSFGSWFLILTPWVTLVWSFELIRNSTEWISPIIALALSGILFFLPKSRPGKKILGKPVILRIIAPLTVLGRLIGKFFQFEWLFFLGRMVNSLIARPLTFLVDILEGDGGLLWAFLLLALISSVLIGEILP